MKNKNQKKKCITEKVIAWTGSVDEGGKSIHRFLSKCEFREIDSGPLIGVAGHCYLATGNMASDLQLKL